MLELGELELDEVDELFDCVPVPAFALRILPFVDCVVVEDDIPGLLAESGGDVDGYVLDGPVGGFISVLCVVFTFGEVPVGDIPVGEVPVGEVPVGEVPVGGVPVGEVAVGGVPVGELPVDGVPVGEAVDCAGDVPATPDDPEALDGVAPPVAPDEPEVVCARAAVVPANARATASATGLNLLIVLSLKGRSASPQSTQSLYL